MPMQEFAKRFMDRFADHLEEFDRHTAKHDAHLKSLWAADHQTMGRVLRSHLVVENFETSTNCPPLRKALGLDR